MAGRVLLSSAFFGRSPDRDMVLKVGHSSDTHSIHLLCRQVAGRPCTSCRFRSCIFLLDMLVPILYGHTVNRKSRYPPLFRFDFSDHALSKASLPASILSHPVPLLSTGSATLLGRASVCFLLLSVLEKESFRDPQSSDPDIRLTFLIVAVHERP